MNERNAYYKYSYFLFVTQVCSANICNTHAQWIYSARRMRKKTGTHTDYYFLIRFIYYVYLPTRHICMSPHIKSLYKWLIIIIFWNHPELGWAHKSMSFCQRFRRGSAVRKCARHVPAARASPIPNRVNPSSRRHRYIVPEPTI